MPPKMSHYHYPAQRSFSVDETKDDSDASSRISRIRGCGHNQQHLNWYEQTVQYIESQVENTILRSPFLQTILPRTTPNIKRDADDSNSILLADENDIDDDDDEMYFGLFHRSEIRTGQLVGKGGFSDVYEIIEFDLSEEISKTLSIEHQWVRQRYAKNVYDKHTGQTRFVIKQLQYSLLQSNPMEFQRAAADLAIEAAYMSVLNHPNILSLRGLPVDGIDAFLDGEHDSYFIITDRLHETLEERINRWKIHSRAEVQYDDNDNGTFEMKIQYGHELASALQYLHEKRIIFRDLKPANIGFTRSIGSASIGKIQLFDFGLCRQLPSLDESFTLENDGDGCEKEMVFEMSGVGTRRYMAPENVLTSQYNCKADVYSWSLIVWEMLRLETPYKNYSSLQQHKQYVCEGGQRPLIPTNWPESVQLLLINSWKENIHDRVSIHVVCKELESILHVIAEENKMLEQQWLLREYFSQPISLAESIRHLTTKNNTKRTSSANQAITKRENATTTSSTNNKYRRIYNFQWSDMINIGGGSPLNCGTMLPILTCLSDDTADDDDDYASVIAPAASSSERDDDQRDGRIYYKI